MKLLYIIYLLRLSLVSISFVMQISPIVLHESLLLKDQSWQYS